MKHYAYPIFANTAERVLNYYIVKYGSEATVREHLTTFQPGAEINKFGWDMSALSEDDWKGATLTLPTPKKGRERHSDVLIRGRWHDQSPSRLAIVKPWDILVPIGHGGVTESGKVVANACYSDDGSETRTVNDLVDWFGKDKDNLSKDHVLIKLAMCVSGGGGEATPSDCFAKNLAMALSRAGWATIAVGGYRGYLFKGEATYNAKQREIIGEGATQYMKVGLLEVPLAKGEVQHLGSPSTLPARDNMIYFKGDGSILPPNELLCVKVLMSNFPAQGDPKHQAQYVKDMIVGINGKNPAMLKAFPGEVLRMLKRRLGIGPNLSQTSPAQPTPVQTQAQPQAPTQARAQSQRQAPPASGKKCPGTGRPYASNKSWCTCCGPPKKLVSS